MERAYLLGWIATRLLESLRTLLTQQCVNQQLLTSVLMVIVPRLQQLVLPSW